MNQIYAFGMGSSNSLERTRFIHAKIEELADFTQGLEADIDSL